MWLFIAVVDWVKVIANDQSWSNGVIHRKDKLGERVNV
jgi:hypothetical protein